MRSDNLPRWHGFDLQRTSVADSEERFVEGDSRWISGWGFDFGRLPVVHRYWIGNHRLDFREDAFTEIDEAIEYGRKHGVHVNFNSNENTVDKLTIDRNQTIAGWSA